MATLRQADKRTAFGPATPVTRGQMAVFPVRTFGLEGIVAGWGPEKTLR